MSAFAGGDILKVFLSELTVTKEEAEPMVKEMVTDPSAGSAIVGKVYDLVPPATTL